MNTNNEGPCYLIQYSDGSIGKKALSIDSVKADAFEYLKGHPSVSHCTICRIVPELKVSIVMAIEDASEAGKE